LGGSTLQATNDLDSAYQVKKKINFFVKIFHLTTGHFFILFFQYFIVLSSRAQARDPLSRGIVRGKIRRESNSAHCKQQRADRRMDPVPVHGMTALIFCFIMKI
jgi:hypothetical protein